MQNRKGFTLVELMVVIAIIAILAVGSITGYSAYIKKARDNTRVTELKAVENAVTAYVVDNTNVPLSAGAGDASNIIDEVVKDINGELPSDPTSGRSEFYYSDCPGTNASADDFLVAVILESENVGAASNDRDGDTPRVLEVGNVDVVTCLGTVAATGIPLSTASVLTDIADGTLTTLPAGWVKIEEIPAS